MLQTYLQMETFKIKARLNLACQVDLSIQSFSHVQVRQEINQTNSYKAQGYDLVAGEILKHKVEIIMIPKQCKPPTEKSSLLPILSKIFENLVIKQTKRLISAHQF